MTHRHGIGVVKLFHALAASSGLLVASCASNGMPMPSGQKFPLAQAGPELRLRVSSKPLTDDSVAVVIELFAATPLSHVRVKVAPGVAAISITPTACFFQVLNPPVAKHASRPPYPLPAVPLCTFIVRAHSGGSYPVTVEVEDAMGKRLLPPLNGIAVIRGVEP